VRPIAHPEDERVRTIRVPVAQPSCPVFVSQNFDRAPRKFGVMQNRGCHLRRQSLISGFLVE
jgi:hypothetical protein